MCEKRKRTKRKTECHEGTRNTMCSDSGWMLLRDRSKKDSDLTGDVADNRHGEEGLVVKYVAPVSTPYKPLGGGYNGVESGLFGIERRRKFVNTKNKPNWRHVGV